MRRVILFCVTLALIGITIVSINPDEQVDAVSCKGVHAIFARGSGQALGKGEFTEWRDQLRARINKDELEIYELGSRSINGNQYPAVDVGNWKNGNAAGAWLSGGEGNDYGRSVNQGYAELESYMNETDRKCPSTLYILGGYSQGAQVVGDALKYISASQRARVVFIGLFGDPKLYLPEGKGFSPPACHGKKLSPWRRKIGDCNTDRGSLGARTPYLPADLEHSTGLWCNSHDAICGGSPWLWDTSGHGEYKNSGQAIDQAASEAASKLQARLHISGSDDTTPVETHESGLDVVFIIDTTGSMSSQIDSAKQLASTLANKVIAANGRVALVEYRDKGDSPEASIRQVLTKEGTDFAAAVAPLSAYGGGDTPEATLHALKVSFDGLEWQKGAEKAAIIITDAPYHDPDLIDGSTTESIIKQSLEIDPVNIYVVAAAGVSSGYQILTNGTAGQVIHDNGDTSAALMRALTNVLSRPIVLLPLDSYSGISGDSMHFDASQSTVKDASITKYDWDFDGDGAFDQTTTKPIVDHVYMSDFSGTMQVRATASNGTVASTTASVEITRALPNYELDAPTSLLATVLPNNQVQLKWTSPSNSIVTKWGVMMNDAPLGMVEAKRTTTIITDVDRMVDNTFGVMAVNDEGLHSDFVTVTLSSQSKIASSTASSSSHSDARVGPNSTITVDGAENIATHHQANSKHQTESSLLPFSQALRSTGIITKNHTQSFMNMMVVGAVSALVIATLSYGVWRFIRRGLIN